MSCYSCKVDNSVLLAEACPHHPDTKLEYLVLAGLAAVSRWYKGKAKVRHIQDVTIPH